MIKLFKSKDVKMWGATIRLLECKDCGIDKPEYTIQLLKPTQESREAQIKKELSIINPCHKVKIKRYCKFIQLRDDNKTTDDPLFV